jgi:hypothetical protein
MKIPGPLLAVGIVGSIVLIAAPSIATYRFEPVGGSAVLEIMHAMLPVWLLALIHLSIHAGREMERRSRDVEGREPEER